MVSSAKLCLSDLLTEGKPARHLFSEGGYTMQNVIRSNKTMSDEELSKIKEIDWES
jgi:hypothetical protein